jgi:uncharacterized membrane protein YccC
MAPPDAGPAAGRAGRRLLADLRAGRAFLAAELSQPGWLDFGAFRWHDVAPGRAARAAFGVITPLALGVALGRTEYGSFAALGALPAGFVSFRGVTRSRVEAVVAAAVGMAVSTFVGAWAEASHPWLLVPVIFCWSYAIGLLAALGPTALVVSLQWPVALLIASALPLEPGPAAIRALLVLAGGLWQGLLVIASWAVGRGSAERTAMSGSLSALADYAASLAAGSRNPPPPATTAARQALRDPNPLMRSAARLQLLELTEEAERIRASLTALGVARTADGSAPEAAGLLSAAAVVLRELAEALTGWPGQRAGHFDAACATVDLTAPEPGTRSEWAGDALLGQLRAVCRITGALNDAEPARPRRSRAVRGRPQLTEVLLTLRASVGTSSEAGRHALRLAVVTAVAEVIVRAAGLPHGYWGVLTIFIVLRPDYSSTLYRGLQRAAGTLVGAGLGVLTVRLGHFGIGVLLAALAVSLLAAYAVFTVNYVLYAVFLTDFVVVLLALLGLPPEATAVDRLIGTGVGTGLALIAYILWPTWEGTSAAEKFARLFSLQGRYASAMLRAYTRPGDRDSPRLRDLQLAVRRARIDADASADRLAGEPSHPPMTAQLARGLIGAGHRLAQACIALTATVAAHDRSGTGSELDSILQPRLDALADGVADATSRLAQAVRELGTPQVRAVPERFPGLRAQQRALRLDPARPPQDPGRESHDPGPPPHDPGGPPAGSADSRTGLPGEAAGLTGEAAGLTGEAAGLPAATDSLVDAIDTAAEILRHPGEVP